MVPNNASSIVQSVVAEAQTHGGMFESTSVCGTGIRHHSTITQALLTWRRRMWETISYWNPPAYRSLELRLLLALRYWPSQVRRSRSDA